MAERRGIFATLGPWLRLHDQHRGRLVVGALLMLATALSALGLLAVSGWFITASALTGVALAAGAAATLDVYTPGGGIRLFAVSRTVSRYLERLYNHDTILRLLADLRVRMFAGLARMDASRLAGRRASDWLNRLTADIDTLDALYLRLLAPPLVALLLGAALLALVAIWLPGVVLWLGGLLLFAWCWLTFGQARLGMVASRRRVETLEQLRSGVMESLRGFAELEAYGALDRRRTQLEDIEAQLFKDQWRLAVVTAIGNALVAALIGGTWLLLLMMGAAAFANGGLSAPIMVMLPLAAMALSEGLAALPGAFTQLGATLAAAERLNVIDDAAIMPEGDAALPPGPLSLSGKALSFRYSGALFDALHDVNLHVAAGESVALCGPSGAGKSTLLALVSGQLNLQQGQLSIGGHPVDMLAPDALAAGVGCLTQSVDLFDASLAENLRLAAPEADDACLWAALEAVDLKDWAQALPAGLETRVGEGGRQVSGGQARRIALARLSLTQPGLVLLDEPFAGLDAATAERVAERLEPWFKQRTVVYLVHEHDPATPKPGMSKVTRSIGLAPRHASTWRTTVESVTL